MSNKKEMLNGLIKTRRDLHRIPELDNDLPKTTAYLKEYLEKLPCHITDIGKAGFTAFFDGGFDDAIAFRTDMDALPIYEETGLDFCSIHEGNMHACGHDGHMSIMLGFASEVSELLETNSDNSQANPVKTDDNQQSQSKKLNHNVLLVFQASEETTGGALEICESGIFEKYNTRKIYGLHIWPGYPENTVISREGPFMAGTKVLRLGIDGRSSHIARPHEGIDALDIGTRLVQDIYKMEKQEIPASVPRILKFGEFISGTGVNIISERTDIGGTVRFFDRKILNTMLRRMEEISKNFESRFGCRIRIETSVGYPPVINPDCMVKDLEKIVHRLNSLVNTDDISRTNQPLRFHRIKEPLLTAEDFADYQERLPGLFFFLGTGLELSLHNGNYDINEKVLPTGVELFKALLLNS